jgi:hypothetical protein
LLRRVLGLAVLLYLTADYCDPSEPGVFWLGTDSYFLDSTEARTAMPILASPAPYAALPGREVLEPITPRVRVTAPLPARVERHSPHRYAALSPPPAPESSDDH